nr:malectin domain-containing carbohydrate-binding protein [Deinococcus koreensis]
MATVTALSLLACDRSSVPAAVTKITVTPPTVTLLPNGTQKLEAKVEGAGSFDQSVVWSTNDPQTATVTPDGIVKALKVGAATITAKSVSDPSKTDSSKISVVVGATVSKIEVTPTTAAINVGKTQLFTAKVTGTGEFGGVAWKSSNPGIASVAEDGTVTGVAAGQATITATSTLDSTKSDSSQVTVSPVVVAQPNIVLTNLDGGPFQNWLSFSKVGTGVPATPSTTEHNVSTLRISNTGVDPLNVNLQITGTFTLLSGPPAFTVAPGASSDVKVRFVGDNLPVQRGTLVVQSNDPQTPSTTIQLAGAWQPVYENNQEPNLDQLVRETLGFTTAFSTGGQSINQKGSVMAQGDEMLSPFWQRANTSQPVNVWQLAAYHTQNSTATLYWHSKADSAALQVLKHAPTSAQSILPRKDDGSVLAQANFTPTAATFGFRIDNSEWSDDTRNSQTADRRNGCVDPCGHHLRFYKAKNPAGQVMPNTYLLIMDYSGINYDYNDNVYLISNVQPAPFLIDTGVGAGASYTDPAGNVWTSDRDRNNVASFTPNTAVNEPATATSVEILGTDNDQLYRTYRGNVGGVTPRTLTYNIPLENGTYQLKLHFAELNWTTAGKRVFDVLVNGQVKISNLDIVAQAGGANTALVLPVPSVQVTNGKLNLAFAASVDYPSISGIEISR